MALVKTKHPENAPGKYYIDDDCIDCSLCEEISPHHFAPNRVGGYHVVQVQPLARQEAELLEEAMELCPTEAIGVDDSVIQ
jgi:ferredoxin